MAAVDDPVDHDSAAASVPNSRLATCGWISSAAENGSLLTRRRSLGGMFKAAGVANASSHSLRRTHANELRRTGADLKLIQEQLGHRSLATTERYFDVDPLEKAAAMAKLRF